MGIFEKLIDNDFEYWLQKRDGEEVDTVARIWAENIDQATYAVAEIIRGYVGSLETGDIVSYYLVPIPYRGGVLRAWGYN